jgi:hypothetical protein
MVTSAAARNSHSRCSEWVSSFQERGQRPYNTLGREQASIGIRLQLSSYSSRQGTIQVEQVFEDAS